MRAFVGGGELCVHMLGVCMCMDPWVGGGGEGLCVCACMGVVCMCACVGVVCVCMCGGCD